MEFLEIAPLMFVLELLAGLIDAIAGGGGLITVPALLWAGLPPVAALATNKTQAVWGSFAATAHFVRQGAIDLWRACFMVACTFVGAAFGTLLVQQLRSDLLEQLVPLLLIGFALYFLFSLRVSDLDSHQRIRISVFALTIGVGVGFYDGLVLNMACRRHGAIFSRGAPWMPKSSIQSISGR